jgi:uncharacterized beta-barrel protein YwiB (DUF1934 family)
LCRQVRRLACRQLAATLATVRQQALQRRMHFIKGRRSAARLAHHTAPTIRFRSP